MNRFLRLSAVSLACVLALSACNKPATETTTETKSESTSDNKAQTTTETKTDTPAPTADTGAKDTGVNLDTSPTVLMMADTLKIGAWGVIHTTANISTQEHLDCLFDYDKALFLEAGKAETQKMLSADLIKASDEFYATEVGQKMLKFMEQTQLESQGKPIEGEKVVISEEDKAKMAEFGQSEVGKKIAEATAKGTDPQAVQKLVEELANKEKARCKLA